MACIGQPLEDLTQSEVNNEDEDWDWNNKDDNEDDGFFFRKKRSVPNYRTSSGKCMWGMLKDLNNTEHETVRIETGEQDFRSKGKIVDLDGRTAFGAWQPQCDRYFDEKLFLNQVKTSIKPKTLITFFSALQAA